MINSDSLRCPCSDKAKLKKEADGFRCLKANCHHHMDENIFSILDGVPVLISDVRCDTLCEPSSLINYIERSDQGHFLFLKKLIGVSKVTLANCHTFVKELDSASALPKVLVIGSGERGSGVDELFDDKRIDITGVDIYKSNLTDIICDGHYLPFEGDIFDGVWVQAVLEHVVEPQVVVKEISRVLKNNGIIYAETPFMQQVHEGAYDYTRFTVLGHRYLFRDFQAIKFGGNQGANIVLSWSLKYFILAVTRSKMLARIVGVTTTILLRPFECLLSKHSLFDSSSGVYFLGRKASSRMKHKDLPVLYEGMLK